MSQRAANWRDDEEYSFDEDGPTAAEEVADGIREPTTTGRDISLGQPCTPVALQERRGDVRGTVDEADQPVISIVEWGSRIVSVSDAEFSRERQIRPVR